MSNPSFIAPMKMKFVSEYKSRNTVKKHHPWATVVARCEGGWMCFESYSDYLVWKNQK